MIRDEGAPKGQLNKLLLSQPCNKVQPCGSKDTREAETRHILNLKVSKSSVGAALCLNTLNANCDSLLYLPEYTNSACNQMHFLL